MRREKERGAKKFSFSSFSFPSFTFFPSLYKIGFSLASLPTFLYLSYLLLLRFEKKFCSFPCLSNALSLSLPVYAAKRKLKEREMQQIDRPLSLYCTNTHTTKETHKNTHRKIETHTLYGKNDKPPLNLLVSISIVFHGAFRVFLFISLLVDACGSAENCYNLQRKRWEKK